MKKGGLPALKLMSLGDRYLMTVGEVSEGRGGLDGAGVSKQACQQQVAQTPRLRGQVAPLQGTRHSRQRDLRG